MITLNCFKNGLFIAFIKDLLPEPLSPRMIRWQGFISDLVPTLFNKFDHKLTLGSLKAEDITDYYISESVGRV